MAGNDVLSFEDWLLYEYEISYDEYKSYSKQEKASFRKQYDEYVKENG